MYTPATPRTAFAVSQDRMSRWPCPLARMQVMAERATGTASSSDVDDESQSSARRDRLWTIEELAMFLGVPRQTIYRWNHTGDGPPPLKVGRHCRYRRLDVERWLDTISAQRPVDDGGRRGLQ